MGYSVGQLYCLLLSFFFKENAGIFSRIEEMDSILLHIDYRKYQDPITNLCIQFHQFDLLDLVDLSIQFLQYDPVDLEDQSIQYFQFVLEVQ